MTRPGEQDAVEQLQVAGVVLSPRPGLRWDSVSPLEAVMITAAVYPIIAAAVLRDLARLEAGETMSTRLINAIADSYESGKKS